MNPRYAIIALFVVSRVLAAMVPFGITDYPLGELVINDVTLYGRWGDDLLVGDFPAGDPMWQYPPLAAALFATGALAEGSAGFMLLAFAADAAAMAALLVAAGRSGRHGGAWLWAAAALIVGPVFLTRFDVFPTAAVIVALLLASTRPGLAGAFIGLGTALKVWPVLALVSVRRRALPAAVAGFAAVVAVTSLVAWWWFGPQAWWFLTGQSERGLQIESVAALPFLLAGVAGADIDAAFRYGSMELNVPGAGVAASLATLIGLLLLGALGVARLAGRLETLPGADVAFATVLVSVVTSRVFSPQYSIWLVGIAAVCLAAARTTMTRPVLLICLAAVITQAIYPPLYTELINSDPWATALQTLRIGLVLAATVLALRAVLLGARRQPRDASGSSPASKTLSRSEMSSQRQ